MKLNKVAAVLAWIIGGMAIFAGSKVVIFHQPVDYYVIAWLPVYNLTLGLITFFLVAPWLWKDKAVAPKFALATLISHGTVLLLLQTAYREVVASESLRAMTIRVVTWVIIVAILIVDQHVLGKEVVHHQQG